MFAQDLEAFSLFVIALSIVGIFAAVGFLVFKLGTTVQILNKELDGVGPQIKGILGRVEATVTELGDGAKQRLDQTGKNLNHLFAGAERALDSLLFTLKLVEKGVAPLLITIAGLAAGLNRFLSFFRERGERKSA